MLGGARGRGGGMEAKKAGALTEKERNGHIFTAEQKRLMSKAFVIPDLAAVRGDPVEREKDCRWKGAAQFVKTLSKGYTLAEASQMLNINVSPLHFAMALLESRGQHIEDPYLIAAVFGIDQSHLTVDALAAGDRSSEELLAKLTSNEESVEAFVQRIQTDLREHIETIQKLHDRVFSYKYRILEVSSREGKPERRLTGERVVKLPHSVTWDSYQDCSVLEGSNYYKSKPWPRQPERHLKELKQDAAKMELMRKQRAMEEKEARALEESKRENLRVDVAERSAPATKGETLAYQNLTSPRRILARKMAKTQRRLTKAVVHLHSAAWAQEFNNEAFVNRHMPQRPLSSLRGPRDLQAELHARYAEEMLPKVKLPMSALPGGTDPTRGLMTHTGALCPSFDQRWTTEGVCNRDVSEEDHKLLESLSIIIQPAEKKPDRMAPEGLKHQTSSTGSPEKKLRSRRSISGTNTPLSSPSPQGSIRSAPVSRASIRQGLGRRLKLQFPLFDDQRDVDKDVLVDYDAYMRKRLSTAASGSLLHASRDSSGGWLPLRYLSEDEPNTLVEEDVNTDAVLYEHTDYVPHLQRYCAQPGGSLRGEMVGVHTELGMFFKSASEKLGAGLETQDDSRGPGATISQGFVDVLPSESIGMASVPYSPIFVATDISELSDIVARTQQARLGDLVLLQTGLPRAIVRERQEGCRFREFHDLHQHVSCSSSHGKQIQEKAALQSMLRWMETRKIMGSVRDEVKRLEKLHHTMLSVNEHLMRFLDSVAITATSKCSDTQSSNYLPGERSRDPELSGAAAPLYAANAANGPALSASQHMRKTVEIESDEYKRKLVSQRQMLRDIESEILTIRKTLHMHSQPGDVSSTRCVTSEEVNDQGLTIVVLNLLVLPDQSPIIFDTCFVHGRFSRSACELLQMMKVDCQEVASAEEVDARGWLNAIWTSSMWLISASHDGCCIRDVMALHHARLQTLIAELAPIAQRAHMRDFSVTNGLGEEADIAPIRGAMGAHVAGNDLLGVDMVMSDIQARSRQYRVGAHVPCKQEALRQVRWLNGSFLRNAGASEQPFHMELLKSQDIDVTLLQLQGERQKLQASRLHQCLASLPSGPRSER